MLKCNLRKLMAEHRIDDISDLMRLSGISRNSINKLYRETNIETTKLETLFKLCDTFQCTLSELIEYEPEDKKEA
ncbi:helix-turn-helix transcriptional regulator [Paenibacillus sp. MZ04-78.2]|uniref:XRE family transcriptional regulator n=1 Tax=Paenibacillus elgii TaxID=189691 RepID=A0A2T6G0I1_9BACL|nr:MULTISPECIES: helix-turn-helix transcriptional regulator [Paenibacillus]MCM3267867.1 helix-turn-helix transcriptional regulator [Paenibacillus elgii]MCP3776103.1 helix-turn-helix transcriptional regulator [Paenibacillus sp. MZ04-78.2]PUA37621.1 XRE family transcriptional regulator [Paenibacillus elgii]